MTTKDIVYLSLLALSAIVFYWAGFYGGFNTTLKILQARENETANESDLEVAAPVEPLLPITAQEDSTPCRRQNTVSVGSHGLPKQKNFFGRN